MRRWLAILLLVLMPAQATWAVAAGYCVHTPGAAASDHLGHHDPSAHGHASVLADAPQAQDAGSDGAPHGHHDCGHCHGQCAGLLIGLAPLPLERIPGPSVQPIDDPWAALASVRPERPKWAPLA
ncbi:hypothetical protein [Acidovorax sp. SDU_ACID1]|uniref:hypothetical protein n=1 Tax=Acidovorax sp. SDU_ACID1 TaxID=3136632 RepID=UPI003872D277